MQERRFEFEREKLELIKATDKRQYFYDTHSNLELMVTPKGVKTFYAYKWNRNRGVPDRSMIGRFGELTIHQARRECEKLMAKFTMGIDPNAERRAMRAEMTLGELFNLCLESEYKMHCKSWPEYQKIYDRYLVQWKNRSISEISKTHVQILHARLGKENGIYSANRMLQLLSSLLNKAIAKGWENPNPCKGIKKFREKSRDRFLEADELPRFFKAVYKIRKNYTDEDETVRDYVLTSLLTGARRSNVLSMKWEDINIERREWLIPRTKNGESQRVVLSAEVLKILESRNNKGSEFVFPGDSPTGHFNNPKRGWARILKNAKIKNLRLHDLRRSLGSWQAATGANLSVIGKTLGHKTLSATAIYARLNLDPVRSSVQTATEAMLIAGKVIEKPKDNKAEEERKVA